MNPKKIKIILYLPLALLFIANFFCYPLPAKAEEVCAWRQVSDCSGYGTEIFNTGDQTTKCGAAKPSECTFGKYCACCCKTVTSSGLNTTMPKFKIPDINLQISIPGLSLTKGADILANCQKDAKGNPTKCTFPWISEYVAGIYKYAIGIVGILAAVVLMIGGVIWIVAGGSATMIGEAKAWIGASLTGLVIALCSYIILYQVNPALVGFRGLEIQMVDQIPIPEDVKEFAAKCKPTDIGECAVSKMSIFGSKASEASAICMAESGGNKNNYNKTTGCSNGGYAVWGLFQFNLSDNNSFWDGSQYLNCKSAFGNKAWRNSSPTCTVTNVGLYNQCRTAATDASLSIINAKRLAGGSNWGPWEANTKWCKF